MSKTNRTWLWMSSAVLCLLLPATRVYAEPLIGYVHLQRAILEVEEGKRAKTSLRKTFEAKQKSLNKREVELKSLQSAIGQESVVKTDAASKQKEKEFQMKLLELQQTFVKEQKELQSLEQKELGKITKKMREVIQKIGKSGKYTLILEVQENRLLYAKAHLDVTNEVIRRYNARYK